MAETIGVVITTLLIGLLIAVPAGVIEIFLVKAGIVRNHIWTLIIAIIVLVFIKRIWFDEISWGVLVILITIISVLSLNRGDLWTTIVKGRWWWKENKE